MILLTAPVQGHTDAAFRHWHNKVYDVKTTYFTPFIRWEKDGPRNRDVKDMTSPLNEGLEVVPQIIFRDRDELLSLLNLMKDNGVKRVDLNIGCPFPLQTSAGRGAAMISDTKTLPFLPEIISEYNDIVFSAKLRLGYANPEEWRMAIDSLNKIDLKYVTLHPRVARQQYGGEPDLYQFEYFLKESANPVIYNGDITDPLDINHICERFPEIAGVMVGRGLLARPSILSEHLQGKEWPLAMRLEKMMSFHDALFNHYEEILCGDSQILSKIKPFWEYSEQEIGRKAWKAIKKATSIAKYNSALALIDA